MLQPVYTSLHVTATGRTTLTYDTNANETAGHRSKEDDVSRGIYFPM
ncbi:hypothetical protein KK062_20640 [Fulvivirgaceae bacterium PWU5]|uniref:Uncharacterized protein n=1 Tax=Dawidia cretensis TaxID=2782350 RepID=A0AAP2E091_9BACT|nr:hypothetical protein [Dawidia cretensis]MBT1710661.1 hypothetical protein [Dawidia cretensis]